MRGGMLASSRLRPLALLLLAGAARAQDAAPEIVTLRGRGDATASYLLLPAEAPRAVALLFPGGDGVLDLERLRAHPPGERGNFLVRARALLRSPELAVAVLDAPSDRRGGMDDAFRAGAAHRADVTAIVADLRAHYPGARLVLVGTSRGTISAASLGAALGKAVDGVVLSSTVFLRGRAGPGLDGFDLTGIPTPTLLVHHAQDGCPVCPYARALSFSRHLPLITVHGGRPPDSGPCDALSAHGYYGREAETAAAIRAWILGQAFPAEVE
jgi:hypothetical protein